MVGGHCGDGSAVCIEELEAILLFSRFGVGKVEAVTSHVRGDAKQLARPIRHQMREFAGRSRDQEVIQGLDHWLVGAAQLWVVGPNEDRNALGVERLGHFHSEPGLPRTRFAANENSLAGAALDETPNLFQPTELLRATDERWVTAGCEPGRGAAQLGTGRT